MLVIVAKRECWEENQQNQFSVFVKCECKIERCEMMTSFVSERCRFTL
jgi:hypothetical protein